MKNGLDRIHSPLLYLFIFIVHSQSNKIGIDRITNIETSPTQIVVTTTKEGPVEQLKIHLEVTDLDEKRLLPPVSLNGLWLLISRGRYTVPFLKPDHWYGIQFHSENIVDRQPISFNETRIVKTLPRPGQNRSLTVEEPKYEVYLHRNDEVEEENAEGVFLTARWIDAHRMNDSLLVVNVEVKCENSETTDNIVLHDNEDGVTIEIAMDHRLEVEDLNTTSHQVKAHITPLKCHRVCWDSCLVVSAMNRNFTKEFGRTCREIDGTTSTTFLRNMKYHRVYNNELVVETEMLSDNKDEGFVTLSAQDLRDNKSELIYRSFSTSSSSNEFSLPLEENRYYAVQYEYTKVKPFRYSTVEKFLVETSSNDSNSTDTKNNLIDIIYEPTSLKHPLEGKRAEEPSVTISRGKGFVGQSVHLHVEPFCHQNRSFDVKLNDTYPHHELEIPIKHALCSRERSFWFCGEGNFSSCPTLLCYTPRIAVSGEYYEGTMKCVNVISHFDMNSFGSKSSICLLSLLSVALFRIIF